MVPGPGVSFFGEVEEGAGSIRVVRNEASIKVSEPKEGSHVFDG